MTNDDRIAALRNLGIPDEHAYSRRAFARNIGLLSEEEQARLSRARVAIPGMGGVGGQHLISLVRTGVGAFNLADFDTFGPANVNRQLGARVSTFGKPKLDSLMEEALAINPFLRITPFPEGVTAENVDRFLEGADVVLDGLDFFQIGIRRLVFKRALEQGIHVVTAGPLGFSGALLVFAPERGMGFDEYFDISDRTPEETMYVKFAIGLAPRATHIKYFDLKRVNLRAQAGPSSMIACQICSSLAVTEAVKILLRKDGIKPVPHYCQFDPYVRKYRAGYLLGGNRHPAQRLKKVILTRMLRRRREGPAGESPQPPELAAGEASIPQEVVRYLIRMGAMAPSADNCQPWTFTWDGECLQLRPDPERTGFFYDVREESTLMTFGAVVENMRIAASCYGMQMEYALRERECAISACPRGPGQVDPDPLFPFVPHRKTNRKPYRKGSLLERDDWDLRQSLAPFSQNSLFLFSTSRDKKIFNKIIFDADRILFEDERLHQGLFQWVRMQKHAPHPDGMDLSVLEMKGGQRAIFPLFGKWGVISRLNWLGASRIPGMNSLLLLRKTPVYALLTAKGRDSASLFESGRAMERFWITANALGLALQPMAGFVFLLNHYLHDRAGQFAEAHQRLIEAMYTRYRDVIGEDTEYPVMFFRLGYPVGEPEARSPRRDLEDILHMEP